MLVRVALYSQTETLNQITLRYEAQCIC